MYATKTPYPYMSHANKLSFDIIRAAEMSTDFPKKYSHKMHEFRQKTIGKYRRERWEEIQRENENTGFHCWNDDDPSGWSLTKYENANAADIQDWAERNVRLTATPSQYDCTGQVFTTGLKAFQVGKNVLLFHSVAMDI